MTVEAIPSSSPGKLKTYAVTPPEFSHADRLHLRSAEGWLELGDWQSANDELESITPLLRAHPDVLKLRVEIYSAAKRWEYAIEVAATLARELPDESFGFLRLAYALHELKRTKEAWDALLPIADKFPELWVIPYNLACYACQLGNLAEARSWLEQAFKVGDAQELKLEALDDPDLAPLWSAKG